MKKETASSRARLAERPAAPHLAIEDLDAAGDRSQVLFTICIRSGPAGPDATGDRAPSARTGA
ncbi:hypothetical protein ACFCV8_22720 [Streptomyces sp. NPDC056347]|uniref:hypothetical protein n=1 Tax=unclassified Streptomyces TaxID=2593676 RepID=UPI0035DFEA13